MSNIIQVKGLLFVGHRRRRCWMVVTAAGDGRRFAEMARNTINGWFCMRHIVCTSNMNLDPL